VLLVEIVGAATAVLYLKRQDPRAPGAWVPPCPTKLLTRLDCPACGGLRLVHDLMQGDVRAAMHDNPFLLAWSPLLAYLLTRHWRAVLSGRPMVVPPRIANGVLGSAVVWTIVRNIRKWPLRPAGLA
jgi:hypothetical protein